jgi:hypothetical protein
MALWKLQNWMRLFDDQWVILACGTRRGEDSWLGGGRKSWGDGDGSLGETCILCQKREIRMILFLVSRNSQQGDEPSRYLHVRVLGCMYVFSWVGK